MKTITILSFVQTGILLILFGKIVLFEEESTVSGDAEKNALVSIPFDDASTDTHAITAYYPDEYQLRKIVREELAAQLGALSESGAQINPAVILDPEDEAKYQNQRERVAQHLEYHTSVGSISNVDMQKLQADIAKLDEVGRKEMMRRLTRVLNSGRLKGRL